MLALKLKELQKTHNLQQPKGEEESPENGSIPEDIMEETLDQKDVFGSELDSVRLQAENIQVNVGQETLNADRKKDMLSIEKLQERLTLDQQQFSVREATESDVDIDYFWSLDLFTANAAQEQKRVFEEKLHLQAQAYKAQALEQENVKLSAELNHTQSMCERLQCEIRKLELEMTNNSTEHNMVTSPQEDLQREREHLTAVNEVSDLMYKLDCKESQLVAESEKGSEQMEKEMCHVKKMNLNLTQNTLREQGNLELCSKQLQQNVTGIYKNVSDLLAELHHMEKKLREKLEKVAQENLVLQAQVHEFQAPALELQKTLSLLSSKEAYVHQVKEMNLELKRQNTLLQQKNVELSSVLNQFKAKHDSCEERFQQIVLECDSLQKKIREQEDNSTNCGIIRKLQDDLITERDHLTAVHEKVSDLMYKLDCKEKQLVAEREKASEEISVLKAQVNEATENKEEFQKSPILLSSMEMEMCPVKEMNLNLETQKTLLEQGNLELSAKPHQVKAKSYIPGTSGQNLQMKIIHLDLKLADSSKSHNRFITNLLEDLKTERERCISFNDKVLGLINESGCKKTQLMVELEKASQKKMVLQAQVHDAQMTAKEHQKSVSPLSSVEVEVQKVKEMNLDLKRQNTLLEQKNVELSTELSQLRTDKNSNFVHKCDCVQKKISKQADKSTNCHVSRRCKNVIKTENEGLIAINKKVSEMMHELDCKENQLMAEREKALEEISVLKAQVNEATEYKKEFQNLLESMEMELCHMKEMNLNLKTQNTVLEQGNLELSAKLKQLESKPYTTEISTQNLQKKITDLGVLDPMHKFDCKENETMVEQEKASKEKLVLQVQMHEAQASAMELRLQQQNIRLTDKDNECRKIEEDLINTQKANQMLKEELYNIFMECDRMKKKYNENQLTFKLSFHEAKHKFNKKTEGFNSTIQKLENEVKKLTLLLTEEKERFSEYRKKHKHK